MNLDKTDVYPPINEIRLHPDDIKELKHYADRAGWVKALPGLASQFMGVKIIPDINAPRILKK